jgi:UDP-glucose 4-epimerase
VETPRTVAITGLRTFLGQKLAERLLAYDARLRIVGVDVRRPYRLEGRVRFHRADLTDPTADGRLAEIFERESVDVLVHAAFRSVPTPDLEADHELETIGSLHVLHACAARKVGRVVLASSTMLYGPRPDNPNFLSEDQPLRGHPAAHNVMNRVETEKLVRQFGERHPDTGVTVLRPCWIVGPTFWNEVTRYLARPVVPTLLGYDPLLQLVHEEDVLHAFARAVIEPHPGTFNIVGDGVLPLSTLLRLAGKTPLPIPPLLLYRLRYYPSQRQTGDPPEGFYDYLRYLWAEFGQPVYSTREAWLSFVASRRMRRYR